MFPKYKAHAVFKKIKSKRQGIKSGPYLKDFNLGKV